MKTLLLMRHAKSSWKDPDLTDFDRPLKKRGRKDAKRIAKVIDANDLFPDLILSSSARRAVETVEIIIDTLEYENEIIYSDALYMGEPSDFIEALSTLDSDIEKVMIVAHNPGLEAYLQIIDGEIEAMPTGALGYLKLSLEDWRDISFETMGEMVGFWKPKSMESKD
ncbi:MAG: SixA phosphatase family protein [Brevefilum sp.]